MFSLARSHGGDQLSPSLKEVKPTALIPTPPHSPGLELGHRSQRPLYKERSWLREEGVHICLAVLRNLLGI